MGREKRAIEKRKKDGERGEKREEKRKEYEKKKEQERGPPRNSSPFSIHANHLHSPSFLSRSWLSTQRAREQSVPNFGDYFLPREISPKSKNGRANSPTHTNPQAKTFPLHDHPAL